MRRIRWLQRPQWAPHIPDDLASSYASQNGRAVFTPALWHILAGMLFLASLLPGCGPAVSQPASPASKATPTGSADQATLYAGFAAGYLVALRASDGMVRWRIRGYTWSPVLANGMLYTESGADLLAVRPAVDGVVTIWRTLLDAGLTGEPVFHDGILYINSSGLTNDNAAPNGSTYAVDASTGHILWRFQTHGSMFSAPVITADAIYVSAETADGASTLFALNRVDGSLRWHEQRNGYLSNLEVLGGTLYAGATDKMVVALRTRDGAQLWSYPTQGYIDSLTVTGGVETAGAGIVYAASRDKSLYALRAGDGRLLWAYRAGGFMLAPVAVQDGLVYVGSGNGYFAVLDAATGQPQWRTCVDNDTCTTPGAEIGFSTAIVVEQTIYVGAFFYGSIPSGNLAEVAGGVYALDAATGRIRWQYQSGIVGAEMGTPALVGG